MLCGHGMESRQLFWREPTLQCFSTRGTRTFPPSIARRCILTRLCRGCWTPELIENEKRFCLLAELTIQNGEYAILRRSASQSTLRCKSEVPQLRLHHHQAQIKRR